MLMIDLPKLEMFNGTLPETKEADNIHKYFAKCT